ncbi:MAG: DUF4340 domain-containing protein [Planctomycetia bacterium]|nr:DUF4340 domain-containing protein [Planctomycetia bacterium]
MNLKTTLVLLVLLAALMVWIVASPTLPHWVGLPARQAAPVESTTAVILEKELTPDKLRRIEVRLPDRQLVLVREGGPKGEWSLPGKWLTRPQAVQELVTLLTGLRTRFAAVPIQQVEELTATGLNKPAATVLLQTQDEQGNKKDFRLTFAEEPGQEDRFARAVYLRLAEQDGKEFRDLPEAVRLSPGVIALLDRPLEYYQQRRLFPSERVAKAPDSQEKVEKLTAQAVATKSPAGTIALTRQDKDWELKEPVRDRPDPEKLQTLLGAVPDIWAEHFVAKPKNLAEYGLDKPEQTLSVTRPDGQTVTLLIGKESPRTAERRVPRPQMPFGPPMPPGMDTVVDKFRYAKLAGNDQVFEIKEEKLKDIFAGLEALRDSRLARFQTGDVQRVELKYKDVDLVLVKKDGKFRLEKPVDTDAESSKVNELLDKLAQAEAKGVDVIDKGAAKEYELEPPAGTVALTIEEETKKPDGEKEKKTRVLKFQVGKHAGDQKKLYLTVDDWPRINAVADDLLKLVERPALAYRGRSVFDLAGKPIEQIEVQRGDEKYALKLTDGKWNLTAPVAAEADAEKARKLADDLKDLNVVEYVTDTPKDEDLEKLYGLAKPALSVTLQPGGDAKPLTLQVGKQRDGKPEYFARLAGVPRVFVVDKAVRDQLDQPSLALRPTQLWQLSPGDIAAVRIKKGEEPEYTLQRELAAWKLTGPFDATVRKEEAEGILAPLARLKADKFAAHHVKDVKDTGLDKPRVVVTLREAAPEDAKDKAKERVLLLGNPVAQQEPPAYYAKLADSDAVFILPEQVFETVDRSALDLLDRQLLSLDIKGLEQLRGVGPQGTVVLERKDNGWQATAGELKFTPDRRKAESIAGVWALLRADRFAAYGAKVDWAKYGLEKPAFTVTVALKPADPKDKSTTHALALGGPVEGSPQQRYAKLDDRPGVFVLDRAYVEDLNWTTLDLVDRTLLDLDGKAVSALLRKMGDQELEITKTGDQWRIVKPEAQLADGPALDRLLQQLGRLRATRIAAYPAKDVKMFGLDDPAAIITLRQGDGEGKKDVVLKIGEVADMGPQTAGDRFALVEGGDKVGVLPGALVRLLVAKPIAFRERSIAKFVDADRLQLERGPRKATFARVDGNWKLVEPLDAPADQNELDEFINAFAKLRADELIMDKPEDLKPYGLERPEARWRFLNGDKEVLSLLIGDREKTRTGEPGRVYAKLASGDVVFLLDPKLTAQVLGEFRGRSLGEAIDAAQVERVDYGAPGGDPERKPFTLEKVNEAWQVAGKPEAKVNPLRVSETLVTLANLRAERFIVDKDADFKLYGLEPAYLTVELRTRSGAKRQLAIGARAGDSKRHYARVLDGNRSDVFVISEADASRIVRDLAGYVEAPAKPKAE